MSRIYSLVCACSTRSTWTCIIRLKLGVQHLEKLALQAEAGKDDACMLAMLYKTDALGASSRKQIVLCSTNMSIQDAGALKQCFLQHSCDAAAALAAFQAIRLPATSEEVSSMVCKRSCC